MILKKQTVWLLSMLAILVVLSGYYLVEGPTDPTSPTATQNKEGINSGEPADVHVNTKEVTPNTATPSTGNSIEDYFISYKMNRDARQEQELDRYMEVMTNSNAEAKLREEAKRKYEELEALRNQQTELEELIKQAGNYKDVIVVAQDNMVRVIVQAKTLKKDKVVEIINIVKQHMKIPGNNITVEHKA